MRSGGNKQDALQKGHVPSEYKQYVGPKQKKFTSKSNFLKDKSLHDEYQNRYRGDTRPAYTQSNPKKVDKSRMKHEVESRTDAFMQALNSSESDKPNQPLGRKRPITTTGGMKPKKQIIDYAQEDEGNSNNSAKKYRFNKDLDVDGQVKTDQSEIDELDDVIGFMNNKKLSEIGSHNGSGKKQQLSARRVNFDEPAFVPETEVKVTPLVPKKEYDYLDYEENLDNLKKITEEQAKFDYWSNDVDS